MSSIKKVALVALFLVMKQLAFAQAPWVFPFQAVARYPNSGVIANKAIKVRFTIKNATSTGTTVYQETQSTTTSALGLFSVNVGSGTLTAGTAISTLTWGTALKYLQVEMDTLNTGVSYANLGTQQLLSVPYALNAASVGALTASGSNIGIGTTTPTTAKLVISGVPYQQGIDLSTTDQYANMRVIQNSNGIYDKDMFLGYNSGTTSSLHLYSDNSETMTVKGGNVGINNGSPAYDLDVVGTAKVSSTLTVGGNSYFPNLRLFNNNWNNEVDFQNTSASTVDAFNFLTNAGSLIVRFDNLGNLTAKQYYTWSDKKLKSNVKKADYSNVTNLLKVKTYSYKYDKELMKVNHLTADSSLHFGVLAQELETLFPSLVHTDSNGLKAVNYTELIPIVIQTIQQQQSSIDALKADNKKLKADYDARLKAIENKLNKLIIK